MLHYGMPTTTVRLTDELAQQWRAYCAAHGVGPSAALRRLIEQVVSGSDGRPVRSRSTMPDDGRRTVRVCTNLKEPEVEQIRVRTRYHGMSRSRWLAMVVRAALTREPQFMSDEIEALDRSTYQLTSIGRNLNQIARRLNEGQQQQSVEAEQVSALRERIEKHVASVNQLVRQSSERWAIE